MAFNLHDGPVQSLSAAGAMLERASRSEHLEAMRAQVAAAEGLIDYAVTEMRDIMRELRPVAMEADSLVEKVREYAGSYEERWGIPVTVTVGGEELPVAFHTQVSLFRIVQEALTNVRRHSEASSVSIEIEFDPDAVACNVIDDGVGFDADLTRVIGTDSHWGLVGMEERVLLVGGELDVTSAIGEGTRVRARAPRNRP